MVKSDAIQVLKRWSREQEAYQAKPYFRVVAQLIEFDIRRMSSEDVHAYLEVQESLLSFLEAGFKDDFEKVRETSKLIAYLDTWSQEQSRIGSDYGIASSLDLIEQRHSFL